MFSLFPIFGLISFALTLLEVLILLRVIVSFVPQWSRSTWGKIVTIACEPVLFPLRRVVRLPGPVGASLDFSPMLALMLIHLLRTVLRL